MFPHCRLEENELRSHWGRLASAEVLSSILTPKPGFTDFINMLSPQAAEHLGAMRDASARAKRMHFGKTIRLYAPLYVSNYCINDCLYCGFKTTQKGKRRRLSIDEILAEARLIREMGMDSLLLVSGEDPHKISVEFMEKTVRALRDLFSYISIEIYPLSEDGYRKLFDAGVHGMTIYQETYERELYRKLHRAGPKTDYDFRLDAPTRGARAGFYNIGLGALLGLYDWRVEAVSIAAHGLWLRKQYWRSKIQFSFPRITPTSGGFDVPRPVSEAELEQMMLAFRIFFPEADLFLSTRESAELRMRLAPICVSHMSAGSRVNPGGYAEASKNDGASGQFTVRDPSSVEAVRESLEAIGLEAVFKDWDRCLCSSSS